MLGDRSSAAARRHTSRSSGGLLSRTLTLWLGVLWFRVFRLLALFHLFALALLCVRAGRASAASEPDLIAARPAAAPVAVQCMAARAPIPLRLGEQAGSFRLMAPSPFELLLLVDSGRVVTSGLVPEARSRLVDRRALIRQFNRAQHRSPTHADA